MSRRRKRSLEYRIRRSMRRKGFYVELPPLTQADRDQNLMRVEMYIPRSLVPGASSEHGGRT